MRDRTGYYLDGPSASPQPLQRFSSLYSVPISITCSFCIALLFIHVEYLKSDVSLSRYFLHRIPGTGPGPHV